MRGWTILAAAGVSALILGLAPARADPSAEGVAAFNAKDYATALQLLSPLANEGDGAAEFHLGLMRLFGLGVSEDADAARELNRSAAQHGYPQARQLMVAQCLSDDADDAEDDCPQARAWLQADAAAGNVEDQTALGAMYLLGRGGVDKDAGRAVAWFTKAGDAGDARAQSQLGQIYASGAGGVSANPAQSLAWYRKAAAQGDATAQKALAAAGG